MAKWSLENKVAVITGATGGLGRSISEELVKRGCKLGLIDLDQAQINEMASQYGDRIAGGWVADVRKMDQLDAAMKAAAEKFGHIDVVVAGAGIELFYPTLEMSDEAFDRIVDINMTGIFRTFKAAFPWVKLSKGYFLTVSSMAALVHLPYLTSYSATKAANFAFTNSLRLEMEPFGISVGSVHPSWFETPLFNGFTTRPAWKYFMNDDKRIIARRVDISVVRDSIVRAIEKREKTIIVPWYSRPLVYWLGGTLRGFLDWLGPTVKDRENAYCAFMSEPTKL